MAKKFLRLVNGVPRGDLVERLASPGGINYIGNFNAADDTSGWVTYADAAGTAPVDGTGGSPNVTFTRSTSSPLMENASFVFVKDAANRQGQGVSFDFTIDPGLQSQQLSISMLQQLTSGVYAQGDLAFYIYDVTNARIIQPTAFEFVATTIPGVTQNAVWQASSNSVSYRLCLHVASTSTSTYTVKLDNVFVGPQIQNIGVVPRLPTITKLTGSGTYVPPRGLAYIEVHVVGGGGGGGGSGTGASGGSGTGGGTTTFGTSFLSSPGGSGGAGAGVGGIGGTPSVTIGTTGAQIEIQMQGNSGRGAGGSGAETNGSSGNNGGAGPFGGTPNTNYFGAAPNAVADSGSGGSGAGIGVTSAGTGSGGGAGAYIKALIPQTAAGFATGFAYGVGAGGSGGAAGTSGFTGGNGSSGTIIVREHYYGANVVLSDLTSASVIAFDSVGGTSTHSTSISKITGQTVSVDTVGGWDAANSRYIIKVPGIYRITARSGVNNTAYGSSVQIYRNGSNARAASAFSNGGVNANPTATAILILAVNDYIESFLQATAGSTLVDANITSLSIERLSGPQQIQAATPIACRYFDTSGSVYNNGPTTMTFGTRDYDTHNAFASNVFTAPSPGFYEITAFIRGTSTLAVTGELSLRARKNGSGLYLIDSRLYGSLGNQNYSVGGRITIYLLARETIDFRITTSFNNSLVGSTTGHEVFCEFKRVTGLT